MSELFAIFAPFVFAAGMFAIGWFGAGFFIKRRNNG